MKKYLCSILAAVIMISLLTASFNTYAYLDFDFADKGSIGDYEEHPEYAYNDPKNGTNVTYVFDSVTGTLVISHNPSVDPSGNMASYSTSPFKGKSAIRHLIVNEGVTGFCAGAFSGCTGLIDISLPETLTAIANSAFADCTSLTSVTLKGDVKYIGSNAFIGCSSLEEVKLNEGLEDIGQYAFYECGSLEKITFPQSITAIHAYAFYSSGLKSISFDNSNCTIYSDAFLNCTNLSDVKLGNSVTLNSYAFSYCTALKSIDIPGVNETIAENTFYNCTALENVKMNEGTKVIDEDAFNECTAVKTVEIPKSLVSVSDYTFRKCEAITDVYYKGTQAEWNQIEIGKRNEYLTNANIHFNTSAPGLDGCNGNHKWDAGKITKKATYKSNGEKLYTCTVCNTTKTETIAKLKAPTVAKVSGLKASSVKTNAITLKWSSAKNANKYSIYRSTDGKTWKKLATATKLTYTDKNVKAGQKYRYKVKGTHSASGANGEYSSVLKTGTLTAAPKISSLKSTKAKTATVKWNKVTGAKSYIVYTSADGKSFKKYKSGVTGKSLSVTKLTGGKKVYIKIIAVNAYGLKSSYSAIKSVKVKK